MTGARWSKRGLEQVLTVVRETTGLDLILRRADGKYRVQKRIGGGFHDLSPSGQAKETAEWLYAFLAGYETRRRQEDER